MKAKALTTILAAAVILTMTGCGKTAEPDESGSQPLSSAAESTSYPESDPSPPAYDDGEVVGSILVLNDGRGIMLYGADYEDGRKYAETVSEYKRRLGENVNVYSMVIPSQVTFYMPEKYFEDGVSDRELPHIDDINAHLNGVIPIDVYDALKDHAGEEIYYRTDHHWTQLGSYYAAKSFAQTARVPFDELSEYDRNERYGFTGTLYGPNYDVVGKAKPEEFVWYKPKREVKTIRYDAKCENGKEKSYFRSMSTITDDEPFHNVYGGGIITQVTTGLDTGRKLMIIGDSFPWSFTPCLFGSFDEVWFVDYRFCEISAVGLAADKGITDLLFCSSIFTATSSNQERFAEIM